MSLNGVVVVVGARVACSLRALSNMKFEICCGSGPLLEVGFGQEVLHGVIPNRLPKQLAEEQLVGEHREGGNVSSYRRWWW